MTIRLQIPIYIWRWTTTILESMNVSLEDDYMIFLQKKLDQIPNFNQDEIGEIKLVDYNELENLVETIKENPKEYTPWFLPSLTKIMNYLKE